MTEQEIRDKEHQSFLDFVALVKSGAQPVIEWNEEVLECEIFYDPKMRCRVLAVNEDSFEDEVQVYQFVTDFSEFEKYNHEFESANFYDENGLPYLKWSESKFYPKNKKETVYLQNTKNLKQSCQRNCFTIIGDDILVNKPFDNLNCQLSDFLDAEIEDIFTALKSAGIKFAIVPNFEHAGFKVFTSQADNIKAETLVRQSQLGKAVLHRKSKL